MTKNIIQLTKDELNNIHQMIETYKKKYDEIGNLEKTLKTLNIQTFEYELEEQK